MATPTVKHVAADAGQVRNMSTCLQLAKQMGATAEQMAGAIATMIQESGCVNLDHGDRDSAGLFQQRPSMGWGSFAQVTDPAYACRKFLTPYLVACRRGLDPIMASNTVQRSAYAQAPAVWMTEARRNVGLIMGMKDFGSLSVTQTGGGTARAQPYEYSRGSPNAPEDSWTAMGRLADEVQWSRFMRGGVLWYASQRWLSRQSPRFAFATGARGVLAINFDNDARRNAAQMTVTALAKRWSVLPGDVCTVSGQGPGDGLWLVTGTRRSLSDDSTELTLQRPQPALPEPAPASSGGVSVGGITTDRINGAGGPAQAQQLYAAAKEISDQHLPYVWGGGHGSAGTPSGGGYDCSGSVCAALAKAGLGFRMGGPVSVSGAIASSWGAPGRGRWFTVWASSEHVWIQFTGCGPAWRFDTSPHACGPDGPALRYCPRSTATFTPRHWDGL